ncbi:MAG: DUF397 domain-containing protein [Catenulispora sp.]
MSDKPPVVAWRRSLACHQGSCVEVAKAGSIVLVQDSKNPGVYQAWSQREWGELLRCIKVGWRPEGVSDLVGGCVEFGLDRHDVKLTFDVGEWDAFVKGVNNEEFEWERLADYGTWARESSRLSEGVSAGSGSVAGSGEAATGAVDGSGWSSDGPGSPVPVAAELGSLDDCLDITPTGPPPVNPLNIGERRDHDPTSNPASRVLPEAAQPGYVADITWTEDPSLGKPQGPSAGRPVDASTDEVTLSSAVQPGSDTAGTGTPPDPVPAAPEEPPSRSLVLFERQVDMEVWFRDDAIAAEAFGSYDDERWFKCGDYDGDPMCWENVLAANKDVWPSLLTRSVVAPLVPAVETQETVS